MSLLRSAFCAASSFALLVAIGCESADRPAKQPDDAGPGTDAKLPTDPEEYRDPPLSCALDCAESCEPNGYVCPAAAAYADLPHVAACGSWDGKSFPAINGKCTATIPSAEAAKRTGIDPSDPTITILPTGARTKPAGKSSVFNDFKGQFPTNVVIVPGTDLVVVVDGGLREQSVRLVDTTKIGGTEDPVVGREKYTGDTTVNYGVVVLPPASGVSRVYVSGGAGSVLYAFDVELATKKLTRKFDDDVKVVRPTGEPDGGGLGGQYFLSGLSATPDGKRIVVGTGNAKSTGTPVIVVDVDPKSATYKKVLAKIPIANSREVFSVQVHPSDTSGKYAWVSVWDLDRIDVIDLATSTVVKSLAVGKSPEAFAPLGARYMAVVSSDGDKIAVIDTLPVGGAVVLEVGVADKSKYGWSPSGAAFDADAKRLYVTMAGMNAVAAFEVGGLDGTTPTLVPSGGLPTEWWPTALAVKADHALVVVNGKGRGTGANPVEFKPGDGDITQRMRGSIELIPAPDAASLAAGAIAVRKNTAIAELPGASKVECAGAPYDFPIPATNTEGPSKIIKHVVFVIKENKTFDSVFGDLPGLDGDPKLVMTPGEMDDVFGNQRKIAKTFTVFDNYYTSAEQSIQGHIWTAFGRSTDFIERNWLVAWGRGFRFPTMGISGVSKPVEGSVFHWLQRENVLFDNMGELPGAADDPKDGKEPRNFGLDPRYPGKVYAMDKPDAEKSCYIAARARVLCDLRPFTYAVMPNDHTAGGAAARPTVQTYIAVGDEGTGLLVDALSRSPIWNDTLVIITMDDPQDGGDHVDAHRTPLTMASPWIKRGYVSKGHYDVSSLHKLFAHIFGKPYPNEVIARASLPLDAFTSTPDYSPYEIKKRSHVLACNPGGTSAATTAAMSGWDFSQPDQAPGIARQIWELTHKGAPPPKGSFVDDDGDDD